MNEKDIQADLLALLESNLGLPAGSIMVHPDTLLLGAIPELDSMSVVNFLISLEENYGIMIHDDEIDAAIFEKVGNLAQFLKSKIG